MSDPIRYDEVCIEWNGEPAGLAPTKDGDWVKWEDYAKLQAEVERLKIQGGDTEPRFVLLSEYQHIKGLLAFATTKYCRLEAENERLRMAGDAMANELPMIADTHLSDEVWVRMQTDWKRAKEGNPTK